MKSPTDFILISTFLSHIDIILKYLYNTLSDTVNNIHLFIPHCKSHSISKICRTLFLLLYKTWIRTQGLAIINHADIRNTTHNKLNKDSDYSSYKVCYIPQILLQNIQLIHIKPQVSMLLDSIWHDPLSLKDDTFQEHLRKNSLAYNNLSSCVIPDINRVMSKWNTIVTLTFPVSISILSIIILWSHIFPYLKQIWQAHRQKCKSTIGCAKRARTHAQLIVSFP